MHLVYSSECIPAQDLSLLFGRWNNLRHNEKELPLESCINNDDFLRDDKPYCKICLIEAPFRVKYLWVGDALQKLYDEKLQGRYVDELYDLWIRNSVIRSYEMAIANRQPVYVRKGFSTVFGSIGFEYLILPFMNENAEIASAVTCVYPLNRNLKKFSQWHRWVKKTPWLSAHS